MAAQRATTTIPIVFIVVPDPIGTKLVNSLARPGGNITGLTHIAVELSAKRLALFKEVFPNASRAALLVNSSDPPGMRRYIDEFRTAGATLGVTIHPVEVRSPKDFEPALDKIVAERLDGVVVPADGLFYQSRILPRIGAATPSSARRLFARNAGGGALMSYGADQRAIFRRAANYVDKILRAKVLPIFRSTAH